MFVDSKIVVPWDFSGHAQAALEFLLKHLPAENIRVICVLERPDPYTFGAIWGEQAESRARETCTRQFWSLVDRAIYSDLQFTADFGEPATEIVRFARIVEADLIAIATHGRSGISQLMLGSVANRVSQLASCPVLLLPHAWLQANQQEREEAVKTG